MDRAIDPARRIAEIGLERPDRQILKQTLRLPVIHAAPLTVCGADRPTVAAWLDINDKGFHAANDYNADGTINERLEPFDLIE